MKGNSNAIRLKSGFAQPSDLEVRGIVLLRKPECCAVDKDSFVQIFIDDSDMETLSVCSKQASFIVNEDNFNPKLNIWEINVKLNELRRVYLKRELLDKKISLIKASMLSEAYAKIWGKEK